MEERRREVDVPARHRALDSRLDVGADRHERVVDVERARAAVAGHARLRRRSAKAVPAHRGSPARREENLGGAGMVPPREVERQGAGRRALASAGRRRPGEDRPDAFGRLEAGGDGRHRRGIAVAHVDGPGPGHDARRAVVERPRKRRQHRAEVDAAGVLGEPVVRRDPDVRGLGQAGRGEAVLQALDLGVEPEEGLHHQGVAHAVPVGGGVGVAEPEHRHRRVDRRQRDLEKRVDYPAVPRVVGSARLGDRSEALEGLPVQIGRQAVLVVEDGPAGDGMVQQIGRPARARAHDEEPLARRLKGLAEGRRREQALVPARLDPQQVGAVARREEPGGFDPGEEHRVAQQPVGLRIGPGGDGRGVDPGHGREHRVMAGHDDAATPQGVERRHEVGLHVVGAQPVENDQQVTGPLLGRPVLLTGRTVPGHRQRESQRQQVARSQSGHRRRSALDEVQEGAAENDDEREHRAGGEHERGESTRLGEHLWSPLDGGPDRPGRRLNDWATLRGLRRGPHRSRASDSNRPGRGSSPNGLPAVRDARPAFAKS